MEREYSEKISDIMWKVYVSHEITHEQGLEKIDKLLKEYKKIING